MPRPGPTVLRAIRRNRERTAALGECTSANSHCEQPVAKGVAREIQSRKRAKKTSRVRAAG